jgi:hypothetical protein
LNLLAIVVYFVHNPANVRQTSFAAGVLDCALTGSHLLFSHDLFHDQRTAVNDEILFDVFVCIFKTVANKIAHALILKKPVVNGLACL